MNDYLIFKVYGPLASWGDIAVGEIRPSYHYPSKSSIIGLIAAALGIKRNLYKRHNELGKLRFSVRVDMLGTMIEDYHTIQTPSEQAIKKDRDKRYWTRIDEIEAINWRVVKTQSNKEAGAIQSIRTYFCDALNTIAICESKKTKVNWNCLGITQIADIIFYLHNPKYILYLGRKACPLALPLEPQIVEAKNCIDAFQKAKFDFNKELEPIIKNRKAVRYYSDEVLSQSQMKLTRRDQPVNRITWQFTERDEYYFSSKE